MMLRRTCEVLMTALVVIPLMACQGTNALHKAHERGEGENRSYSVSKDQAWDISRHVLQWEGSSSIEEHREKNCMMASFGVNLVSWGSRAGVWIEKCGEESSIVTVICKRKMATSLATIMTEETFQRLFARGVEIVKSGDPLPEEKPE